MLKWLFLIVLIVVAANLGACDLVTSAIMQTTGTALVQVF